jgi:tRNA-splicing ligase RtcB
MGTASYVCVGTERAIEETFGSTCHGAGRMLSRHQAKKQTRGQDIAGELQREGILVQAASKRTLYEEVPRAYKDVDRVVDVMERAGISRKVARLRPIGVLKG